MAQGMPTEKATAQRLIELVESDTSLTRRQRSAAIRLRASLGSPATALSRLQRYAMDDLPAMPRIEPTVGLSRVVSASTFRKYLAEPEVRDTFYSDEDFVRYVDTHPDPSLLLSSFVHHRPVLFEWSRSWLCETRQIRGLDGEELAHALEISSVPPLIVFNFTLKSLQANGVLVRSPCSLDAVLGPNAQWRPGGPVSGAREYVDGDIPTEAVSSIEWRP